eukprot:TRINITY_DN2122_c0_g1_i1.p1 TRINITY_DN2122_c0_g1~~TRINITY_DN2122_c0_g1_i1.p1  ORF type:complete len:402 (+),score=12.89 TRINITY_DN2122_c0_g1_i1:48-1253(+)
MLGVEMRCTWKPVVPRDGVWLGLRSEDMWQPPVGFSFPLLCIGAVFGCVEFHSKVGVESHVVLLLFGSSSLATIVFLAIALFAASPRRRFNSFVCLMTTSGLVLPLIHATCAGSSPSSPVKFITEVTRYFGGAIASLVLQAKIVQGISLVVSSFWVFGLAVYVTRYAFQHGGTSPRDAFPDLGVATCFTAVTAFIIPLFAYSGQRRSQRQRVSRVHDSNALASVIGAPQQEDIESRSTGLFGNMDSFASLEGATQADMELRSLNSLDILFAAECELPTLTESQRKQRAAFMRWTESGAALETVRALPSGRKSHTKAYWYKRFLHGRTMATLALLPRKKGLLKERATRLERLWAHMDEQDRDRDRMSLIIFNFYHRRGRIANGRIPNAIMEQLMVCLDEVEA